MQQSEGTSPEALPHTADDYHNAPSGVGPLAAEWKDKPHRLVYDLLGVIRGKYSLKATPLHGITPKEGGSP